MRLTDRDRYYTGDPVNPMIMVRYDNGSWPEGMEVKMTVTHPDTGVGNVLSKSRVIGFAGQCRRLTNVHKPILIEANGSLHFENFANRLI